MLQKASLSKYWSHSRGCDRYRWTKDGKDFEPPHMTTSDSDRTDGKMVLSYKNLIHFQGKYRCYASNKLGTAMTEEIQLIVAGKYHWPHAKMLRSCCVSSGFNFFFFWIANPKFPKEEIDPLIVQEGEPIVLHCTPPEGVPPRQIYWMTIGKRRTHCCCREDLSIFENGLFSKTSRVMNGVYTKC